jgi:cytochrome c peroxidase
MAAIACYALGVFPMVPVFGAPGDVTTNGRVTSDQFNPPFIGFLFEPEVPLASLKTVPIWNELEQLLDNPYLRTPCSSLPSSPELFRDLYRTTPGTTQITGSPVTPIWPADCSSGVVRRPSFAAGGTLFANPAPLPPLLLHPLNYNPTDGEEMRVLNPSFAQHGLNNQGRWVVPDQLVQCSPPYLNTDDVATNVRPTACLVLNPNVWVWTYRSVQVTNGADRVTPGGAAIDYNAPIRPDIGGQLSVSATPLAFATAAAMSNTALGLAGASLALDIPPVGHCMTTTEVVPPEGSILCGGDPGEPGYLGFGVLSALATSTSLLPGRNFQYSVPAIPGGTATRITNTTTCTPTSPCINVNPVTSTQRLFAPGRPSPEAGTSLATGQGVIQPRDATTGNFGLRKPSLRVPTAGGTPSNPNFLKNRTDTGPVAADPGALTPSNENDYVRNRTLAAVLGKALFWDMQVGSDAVQSCGSCHAHAGADNRTKNQMNPNADASVGGTAVGGHNIFEVGQASPTEQGANHDLTIADFPFRRYALPDVSADPKCTNPIVAQVNGGVLENMPDALTSGATGSVATGVTMTVCDKNNLTSPFTNDVASSMGVHFGTFLDIPSIGSFGPPQEGGVRSVLPDVRSTVVNPNTGISDLIDPIPGFAGIDGSGHQFRRVEPRNTPTVFAAALNFDNFWDGRARHDFNGGSVFGAADPQSHVFVGPVSGNLVPTRQIIRFASLASLATGPGLSKFEMSFDGRNWAKIGKKLLQGNGVQADRVTPLANQLVSSTDSVLGPYSNQGGSACAALAATDRSPGSPAVGKPGLCISYPGLIRQAFYPALWQNTTQHLNGCYTDGRPDIHPNQCPSTVAPDPFDGYVLSIDTTGAANAADTNQFTQMEGNFSLFWGLSIDVWGSLLLPDDTPFDQFLDQNPDAFEALGEVGEPGLVGPLPGCTSTTQRHCFREVGNFKRDVSFTDPNVNACRFPATGEGSTALVTIANCKGTRDPNSNAPDPLLGMDVFQGSNLSLKNPNFRAARCGECHAGATLTDNTMPFTFKAQLGDFIGEFLTPGNEALIEPLGRPRVITGFLLESEFNENGQDAVERRMINQSIKPNATDGIAYPDGLQDPIFAGTNIGAGQSFFDNGVYNLGVTACEADQTHVTGACDDIGRGGTDAFGFPLSLAALLMKNIGGPAQEPGVPIMAYDPDVDEGGGVFEETEQDQEINPGFEGEVINPQLPAYYAPFASEISVGDSAPELDEIHAGINTRTDVAMLEGFIDTLGPFNPAGVLNESMNNGLGPEMGTWPIPNRVGRFGSIKAPQLREVELTGPYFHNGGKATLRQVVDFYSRGGDFPITNATHRDFNIVNLNVEVQSNLTEKEKVALVDFLLELTDDRVRFERGPFDRPQFILPLDGTAFENTGGRAAMLGADCPYAAGVPGGGTPSPLKPGARVCAGGMFVDFPATGTAGISAPLPSFLGIAGRAPGLNGQPIKRLSGAAAFCSTVDSHYCH